MSDDQKPLLNSEIRHDGYQARVPKEMEHGGMQPIVGRAKTAADLAKAGHADFNAPPQQSTNDNKETGA